MANLTSVFAVLGAVTVTHNPPAGEGGMVLMLCEGGLRPRANFSKFDKAYCKQHKEIRIYYHFFGRDCQLISYF